jgi:hypothetical protein
VTGAGAKSFLASNGMMIKCRVCGPLAAALISLLVSNCSHPSDKAIASFADSTTAITSIASSAVNLQTDVDDKTQALRAATSFASGATSVFPPPQGVYLDKQFKKDWAVRVAVLEAIGAYAKALAEANDPALAKSVSDTTTNLSVALSDFQSAAATRAGGSPAAAQRIALVGGIIADAAGLFTEFYTAQQLRAVMTRIHPKLEEARDLLKADLASILSDLKGQQNAYTRALEDKLTKITGLTPSQRYDAYMNAAGDFAAMKARIVILQGSVDGLDAMVEAHKAIIEDTDDKRAVLAFVTFVKDVADKARKLQDLNT